MVDEAVVQPPSCTAQLGHDDCNPPERSHTSVISAENSKSDPDRSPNQRHQPRPGPPPFPRPHPLRSTTASRQGSPASNRNFNESSSGGINLVTLNSKGGGGKKKKGSSWRDEESGEGHLEEEADEGALERRKKEAWGTSYLHEHDSIRNDYSKHYVETGQRPQNFIRGAQVEERFSEYPKLSRLLDLKHALLSSPSYSIPPTYLNLTPSSPHMTLHQQLDPTSFKFDVILVTPPPLTTFEELKALDLGRWSHWPGFVWLWVGDGRNHTENRGGVKRSERGSGGVGLEKGRELLGLWGYRRCEDIVWLKTNRSKADESESPSSLFTPSIEHCLMGIRGTVRRSTDPWFVHCNVDTDVMIWEGDPKDPFLKPPELQSLIENFCQGTRRLHLYGSTRALRRGWLTVKIPTTTIEDHDSSEMFSERSFVRPIERELDPPKEWKPTVFDRSIYTSWFHDTSISGARHIDSFTNLSLNEPQNLFLSTTIPSPLPPYLPYHPELDTLRPKSPPARAGQASSGGLGRGRGAGLGVTRSVVAKGVGLRMLHQQRGQGQGQGQGGSGMGSGMGMGMRGAVFRPPTSSMYQDHKIHPDSILDPIEERTWTTPPPRFTHTPGQEQGHTQGASFELPLHQQQQQHYHLQQRQYHQEWFIPIVGSLNREEVECVGTPSQNNIILQQTNTGVLNPNFSNLPSPSIPSFFQQGYSYPDPSCSSSFIPQYDSHSHHRSLHFGPVSFVDPTTHLLSTTHSYSPSHSYSHSHYPPSQPQAHLQYHHLQQQQPQQQQPQFHSHPPFPLYPIHPHHPSVPSTSSFHSSTTGDWVYPIGGPEAKDG